MVKLFGVADAVGVSALLWQPARKIKRTERDNSLRNTENAPASMIMAGARICGGGSIDRTKQDGGAFSGTDALRIDVGRAWNRDAGANPAFTGAAVGDAGLAERTVNDGKVLRGVSGRCDGVAEAAAEFTGWVSRGGCGVWRVCGCAFDGGGVCVSICGRLWIGPDHHLREYSGGTEIYCTSRIGAGTAELFLQPGSYVVRATFRVAAAAVCSARRIGGICRTLCCGWSRVAVGDALVGHRR